MATVSGKIRCIQLNHTITSNIDNHIAILPCDNFCTSKGLITISCEPIDASLAASQTMVVHQKRFSCDEVFRNPYRIVPVNQAKHSCSGESRTFFPGYPKAQILLVFKRSSDTRSWSKTDLGGHAGALGCDGEKSIDALRISSFGRAAPMSFACVERRKRNGS
jgi:hypothetical protein